MADTYWLRPSDIRIALNSKDEATLSLDLGLSDTRVKIEGGSMIAPNNDKIPLPKVKEGDKTCFIWIDGELSKLRFTGEETGQIYELVETSGRPMLKVSATPFHKWDFIKRIEREMLKGEVLDAGTGLGYTAIAAAKTAKRVITVENDPHVIWLQQNPWSAELRADNIERIDADICDYVKTCDDKIFDAIILDGGTPRSSGDFFSQANYLEMRRVLKDGGRLLHYLPDHGVKRGRDFPAEVIARIKKAGFSDIKRFKEENYVVAS